MKSRLFKSDQLENIWDIYPYIIDEDDGISKTTSVI